ncbi:MAG: hypothetical protein SGJ01_01080 [Gemmatimonadota bacterium]|nr:hypothetical protein [Gemmatimonadota bacterium]
MSENEMTSATAEIIRDAEGEATTKLGDLRRTATEAVDRRRKVAADGLATAAEKLHHTADHLPGVERASEMAHGAADRIGGAADFLRDHDTRAMVDGVQQFVRKHPGKSLAVAAVVGFLAARAFRED